MVRKCIMYLHFTWPCITFNRENKIRRIKSYLESVSESGSGSASKWYGSATLQFSASGGKYRQEIKCTEDRNIGKRCSISFTPLFVFQCNTYVYVLYKIVKCTVHIIIYNIRLSKVLLGFNAININNYFIYFS